MAGGGAAKKLDTSLPGDHIDGYGSVASAPLAPFFRSPGFETGIHPMAPSAAPSRPRLAVLLLGCLSLLLVTGLVTPLAPTARAQDAEEEKETKEGDSAAASSSGQEGGLQRMLRMSVHVVKSVGWTFGLLFLFISIGLVALIVLLAMELRMTSAIPPGFVEDFTDTVNKRRFKEAYEMAKEDGSFVARVLTTGMSRLQYGIEDAREAAENMVSSIRAAKEQLITYLATIGTIGPMLGLVGTVYGMILAFMEMSRAGSTPRADKLADAISHALSVTLVGIGLSVPAIFCHAFFRNRLIRISNESRNVADDLLTQMYHNSKKAAPASPPELVPEVRGVPSASVKPK
jgi:biopolymer transport protein ExbB